MIPFLLAHPAQIILTFLLILSSLGILIAHKPIYASLSFLFSLLVLAAYYLQLSADFIAVIQVLVYAGAILVIFIFVIVLFQNAYEQIDQYKPRSSPVFIWSALLLFLMSLGFLTFQFKETILVKAPLAKGFGSVQTLGKLLYVDYFFPFEATTLLFLVALIGALYIAKKES